MLLELIAQMHTTCTALTAHHC